MKKFLSIILAVLMIFSVMAPLTVFAENGPYPFDPDNEEINLEEFSALGIIDAETYNMAVLYPVTDMFTPEGVFAGVSYNLETNTLTLNNVICKTAVISATEMGDDFKIELIGYNELGGIASEGNQRGASITIIGNGELVLNRTGELCGIEVMAGYTASSVTIEDTAKVKIYSYPEKEMNAIAIYQSAIQDPAQLIVLGEKAVYSTPVVNNYILDIYEQAEVYEISANNLDFFDAGFVKDGVYYVGLEDYDLDTFEPTGKYQLYSVEYDAEYDLYFATEYANGEPVSVKGFTKVSEWDAIYDETTGFYIGYTFFAEEGDDSYKEIFFPTYAELYDLCVDENGTKYAFYQYDYEYEDEDGIEAGTDTYVYNLIEHPVYGLIAIEDESRESLDGLTPIKIGERNLADGYISSNVVVNNGGSITEPKKIKNIKASNTNQGVKITWDADPSAEQYRVYRKAEGSKKWTTLSTFKASKTSFIDKTAKSGKKYTYTVKGFNFVGEGKSNSTGVTHTYYEAPDVEIKNTTKGVYLNWAKVAGATKYRIYRQTSGSSKWTLIDTVKGTSFTDKTAKSGKKYYYRVKAGKGDIMSGYNVVSKYFLSAPELSSVKNKSSGVKVDWDKVTGAEGYKVYRKSGKGSFKYIGKTAKTAYTDKTAKAGTTYTYTVKAYKSKTYSSYNKTGLKIKAK